MMKWFKLSKDERKRINYLKNEETMNRKRALINNIRKEYKKISEKRKDP